MESIYTGILYDDIIYEGPSVDVVKLVEGKYIKFAKSIMVLDFDSSFLDYLKENQKDIDGIIISPIKPVEDISLFKDNLTDLIRYIIFDDQTCVHNLEMMIPDEDLYNASKEAIDENSTLISADQKMFPIADNCLFKQNISAYKAVISMDISNYYWLTGSYAEETDNMIANEPTDSEADVTVLPELPYQYIPSTLDEDMKKCTEIYDTHKFIFNVKKYFTKSFGSMNSSVKGSDFDIIMKYNVLKGRYRGKYLLSNG